MVSRTAECGCRYGHCGLGLFGPGRPAYFSYRFAQKALGGETVTRKKIDDLFKQDVGAVLKFVLGGEVITEAKLRSFERKQLEKKLADDKHSSYLRLPVTRPVPLVTT
jgi:hypothetical protein